MTIYSENHIKVLANFVIHHPEVTTLGGRISAPQQVILSDHTSSKTIINIDNISDIVLSDGVIVLDINQEYIINDFVTCDFSLDTIQYYNEMVVDKSNFVQQSLQYIIDKCIANTIYLSN